MQFSVGPIGAAILGLITLPIVAWFFSPEDIGRLSMLQVTISFALLLFSLGLDQAYVREFHEVDDKSGLLKAVILPGLVILGMTVIVILLLPWSVSELLFGIHSVFLSTLFFASVFLAFFSRFLSLILRMEERGLAFSMSQLLPKLLFLVVLIIYVAIGVDAIFANLMAAYFISISFVFFLFTWNTRGQWPLIFVAKVDKTKLTQMLRYTIPLIGSGVAFWGLTAMDKIFLRSISSFEELGVYSVAVSFAGAALIFQTIFSTIWAPTVYKWAVQGVDPEKIIRTIDYATLAVLVIWSLAGMFSWIIIFITPARYSHVQHILLLAMAYPLLYTLSESTGVGIGIKRKTMFSMLAAVLALGVNALANWLLIPVYGAAGAAMASALAFFIFFLIRTEISSKLWKSYERKKMYISLLLLMSLSFLVNLINLHTLIVVILYGVMLCLSLIAYSVQVIRIRQYVVKNLCKVISKKVG
ncbi:MAG: lipopolysaccharide biosynthesis protein [Methylotenera sp.]|nr:lipopolysaccharide biosynthesis protein [Methylotenera sp.]